MASRFVPSKYSPSGKSVTRYLDTLTGKDVSARQKRNIAEAQGYGYVNLSQKQRQQVSTHKKITFTQIDNKKIGTRHRNYSLGIPNDLQGTIDGIITKVKFGISMMLKATVYNLDTGKEEEKSSQIRKKKPTQTKRMIDELFIAINNYDLNLAIIDFTLTLVDLI